MEMTTEENNLKTRIGCLEAILKQLYWYLEGGKRINPFSEAHQDIGRIVGENTDIVYDD